MTNIHHMWIEIEETRNLYAIYFKGVLIGFTGATDELQARKMHGKLHDFNYSHLTATESLFN